MYNRGVDRRDTRGGPTRETGPDTAAAIHRLLVEHAADVLVHTVAGVVRWVSPEIEDLSGWSPDELVGAPADVVWHPDDLAAVTALRDRGASGETCRGVFRLRHRDGGDRWVELSQRPCRTTDGQAGAVGTLRDVTAAIEAEGVRAGERAELADAVERLRLTVDSSAIGQCLVAPDGGFLQVNPALCRILGREPADLLRCTWQDLTDPRDVDVDQHLVDDVLAGRRDSYRLRKRYLRPDGGLVWGDLSVSCVRDPDGSVRYFISQVVDVTEQVQARHALEDSEARLRMLVENSADVVFRCTADGVLEWLSPSVAVNLGWRPEELVGQPFIDLVHPEDTAAVRFSQRRLGRGRRDSLEARVRTRSGTFRWMSITSAPLHGPAGEVIGRTGAWRDIEAEVRARAALREEEQRYRQLAENATDVVVRVGPDRRVVWVAPSVTESLGWRPDDLVGTQLTELIHPEDAEATRVVRGLVLAPRSTGAGELVMRLRNRRGEYRWFSARATPVPLGGGSGGGAVVGFRDIDRLVRAERAAEEGRARMKAALDAQFDPHVVLEPVRDPAGQVVDFVYVEANAAACAASGIGYREQIGSRLLERESAEDGAWLLEACRRVLETGEPLSLNDVTFGDAAARPDGRRYDIRAVRFADHGLSYTWRDVTERYRAARQAELTAERYRMLAENASDVVLMAGPDRRVQWVAPSVTAVLGWTPDELVGTRLADLLGPGHARVEGARVEGGRGTLADGGDAAHGPGADQLYSMRTTAGERRWMSGPVRPVAGPNGTPLGVVVGLRDVTEEVGTRHRLTAVLDAMPHPYVLLRAMRDRTGGVVDFRVDLANRVAREALGRTPSDRVGAMVPGGSPLGPELVAALATVLATGQPLVLDGRCDPASMDRADAWADLRAVRVDDGVGVSWQSCRTALALGPPRRPGGPGHP